MSTSLEGWYGTNHSTVGVFERFIQSCCRLALVRVSVLGMATRKIASCIAPRFPLLDAAGIGDAEVIGFEQVDGDFHKVYFRDVEIGEFDAEALRFRPVQVLDDEWMFGVNFRQAGSSSIWITSDCR